MKSLKLGVIGTGAVVKEIYQHLYFNSDYSGLVSIEAVCETDEGRLHEFAKEHGIPGERCFSDYHRMIEGVELEAVAVNTPDKFHREPVIDALDAGMDVIVPKPLADNIADADAMIEKAKKERRVLGVDFHKREDPRIKEAKARVQNGDYGRIQCSTWYMLDKLMVADPNYTPRFFASQDFASENTPVSFLTVHMADAYMYITGVRPLSVKAVGYKHKLPSLRPVAVDGYDLVNTEVMFEGGSICNIVTGWALPNSAYAGTVQSARIIGSEGMLDIGIDKSGYSEMLEDGIFERNSVFRNYEPDGTVSGYGIRSPGKIIQAILRHRDGTVSEKERKEWYSPLLLGFYTTLVCESAHVSLSQGTSPAEGVVAGEKVMVKKLVAEKLGGSALTKYFS